MFVKNAARYTLADLFIALGGISRSFHVIATAVAQFVAIKMLRKALIEDIFMV